MRFAISSGVVIAALLVLWPSTRQGGHIDVVEIARIRAHLSAVSAELRSNEPTGLSEAQRAARYRTLRWLDEYRAAGLFPHNHVRPNERVPVFVDPHGTPCAVGYLLLRSGQEHLVDEIVRTDNLVRVPDLGSDDRVSAWLDEVGLTLHEAAMIQPWYGFDPPDPPQSTATYERMTLGLSAATAALAMYSIRGSGDSGAPLADVLLVGAAIGHAYLRLAADRTEEIEPTWATRLNVIGIVANVGSVVIRSARRDTAPGAARSEGFRAYVLPGRNGTELGFTVRR